MFLDGRTCDVGKCGLQKDSIHSRTAKSRFDRGIRRKLSHYCKEYRRRRYIIGEIQRSRAHEITVHLKDTTSLTVLKCLTCQFFRIQFRKGSICCPEVLCLDRKQRYFIAHNIPKVCQKIRYILLPWMILDLWVAHFTLSAAQI